MRLGEGCKTMPLQIKVYLTDLVLNPSRGDSLHEKNSRCRICRREDWSHIARCWNKGGVFTAKAEKYSGYFPSRLTFFAYNARDVRISLQSEMCCTSSIGKPLYLASTVTYSQGSYPSSISLFCSVAPVHRRHLVQLPHARAYK